MACFEDDPKEEDKEEEKIPEYESMSEKKLRITKALQGDICFSYDNESLVEDTSDPCSTELRFKKITQPGEFASSANFYVIAANQKVTTRWQTASTPAHVVKYPCRACAEKTDYDNIAIANWKKGLPNTAYPDCLEASQIPGGEDYYNICCIQNQILTQDMKGKGICGYNSTDPVTFDWAYRKYKKQRPPSCPGQGGVTFIASARPRIVVEVIAKACIGTADGIACEEGTGVSHKKFGTTAEAYGPLEGVVETETTTGPPTYNQECLNLARQGRDSGRPCTLGCTPCPWYKSTKSCGFGFYECTAYPRVGGGMPDVRCAHTGLSTSPNAGAIQLKKLGDFADKSVFNGYNQSWCNKALPRNASLPCAPDPAVGAMGNYCLALAGEMKSANWDGIIGGAYTNAVNDAKKKLGKGCDGSPVATSLVKIQLKINGQNVTIS